MERKVLISASYYAPHISGLTNSIKNLAELLVKNGYAVEVLTTQHRKSLPRKETIAGVGVVRVSYVFKFHKGFFMPAYPLAVYNYVKDAEQVLINLPQFEGFLVAIMAKLLGKKVHCIYACDVTFEKGFISKSVAAILRLANRLSLLLADTVITLSEDFANHNKVLMTLKKNVAAIYPVMLTPPIDLSEKKQLQKKIPPRKYVIGFLGRMSAEKGLEYLLEAVPLLKNLLGEDFIIVLAGPKQTVGEKKYRHKIHTLLEADKKYILQLGELSDTALGAFYSLLDAFVLPSTNATEAFGMVQVEAMLCGTPVVAGNLPGVRVPVQETGMGEIVSLRDPRDLAQKIKTVLTKKENYRKDRESIRQAFSLDKIADCYKKILK